MSRCIRAALCKSEFFECVYQYGHYRRGSTLLLQLFSASHLIKQHWLSSELAQFNVDLKSASNEGFAGTNLFVDETLYSCFEFVEQSAKIDPILARVVEKSLRWEPNGCCRSAALIIFDGFAPSWPRSLHYEILIDKNVVAVEIHTESNEVAFIGDYLAASRPAIAEDFPNALVLWDKAWWGEGKGAASTDLSRRREAGRNCCCYSETLRYDISSVRCACLRRSVLKLRACLFLPPKTPTVNYSAAYQRRQPHCWHRRQPELSGLYNLKSEFVAATLGAAASDNCAA